MQTLGLVAHATEGWGWGLKSRGMRETSKLVTHAEECKCMYNAGKMEEAMGKTGNSTHKALASWSVYNEAIKQKNGFRPILKGFFLKPHPEGGVLSEKPLPGDR